MRITVSSVQQTADGLRVAFATPFYRNGELTNAGNRAMRILQLHHKGGYSTNGDRILLPYGNDIEVLNTQSALQHELNRLANTSIKLRFSEKVFGEGRPERELKTDQDVAGVRQKGEEVRLCLEVGASLPFTGRDIRRLRELVPGGVYPDTENVKKLTLEIWMNRADETFGELTEQNPWAFADELKDRIKKVII